MRIGVVIGLRRVLNNLAGHHAALGNRFRVGAIRAGLKLQRESQRLVPVEYGPLKNSAFTRPVGFGLSTVVYVGYTAFYALYVHEAEGKLRGVPRPSGQGRFWDPIPRAQPKFLEAPARRLTPQIRAIILKEMKI